MIFPRSRSTSAAGIPSFTVYRLSLIVSALSLSAALAAPPSPPSPASISLSTNSIRIGDPVDLTLSVLHPAGSSVSFPSLGNPPDFIVRDRSVSTLPDGDALRTDLSLRFTSLSVTNLVIGENLSISVVSPDATNSVPVPFASLEVVSSLEPGETSPRPLSEDLARWPAPPSRVWTVLALVVVLLLALAAAAVLLVRRALRNPAVFARPAVPPRPPHLVALEALEALAARDLPAQSLHEPFYVALSSIVRSYIEGRFALNAPDLTTEEFIRAALSSRTLSPDHQRLLSEFLAQADLVKFARLVPSRSDMDSAFASASSFVRQTAPAPEKEPAP